MSLPAAKDDKYTNEDYKNWPDDIRCEIIDGVIFDMSPAPRVKHQDILGNLYIKLKEHPNNLCYTGIAPTDVVFDTHNVVQPDVFLVCEKNKITELNIQGPPDLIIEIASPSTELKDKREKKKLYEQSGVHEYIIVFPEAEYIEKYTLDQGEYGKPEITNWDESFSLSTIAIRIDLWEIFDKPKTKKKESG